MNYQTAKIKKITKENHYVKTFVLDAKIKAKPGQFVMIWQPRINEKPFSLSATNPVTFTIAKVGPFTSLLHKLKIGESISFRGPYGKCFKKQKGKVLIIAGGYGVVPLYWLCQNFSSRKNITVIIGAKNKKDLLFIKNFQKLKVDLKVCTDDGSQGFKGFSTDLAEKLAENKKFSQIYTCGPAPMMKKIARMSVEKKIPCQLSLEKYMKCGVGLCGHCTCGSIRACKDGPVISSRKYLLNNSKLNKT